MDLSQFDDKHVRITLTDGSVYEGICMYNSEEYNECERGKDEEGLQLPAMLIGRSEIASVENLEDREDGPWGKFSEPFGALEEEALFDWEGDPVLACEILDCEDSEHVIRMLRCLGFYTNPEAGREIPDREQILKQLRVLVRYSDDPDIVWMASSLIAAWTAEEQA